MKVIINGQEFETEEVRIITQVGDEEEHELYTIVTYEGVIFDAVNGAGNVSLTSSETFSEVFNRLEAEAYEILNDLDLSREDEETEEAWNKDNIFSKD